MSRVYVIKTKALKKSFLLILIHFGRVVYNIHRQNCGTFTLIFLYQLTSLNIKKLKIKFKGFDTTFVVKKNTRNLVGTLKNYNTNIQVDFFSNLPGVQLYSAQNLNYKKKFHMLKIFLQT